jgi:hypothetical protein
MLLLNMLIKSFGAPRNAYSLWRCAISEQRCTLTSMLVREEVQPPEPMAAGGLQVNIGWVSHVLFSCVAPNASLRRLRAHNACQDFVTHHAFEPQQSLACLIQARRMRHAVSFSMHRGVPAPGTCTRGSGHSTPGPWSSL